jgi:hypothetical protein
MTSVTSVPLITIDTPRGRRQNASAIVPKRNLLTIIITSTLISGISPRRSLDFLRAGHLTGSCPPKKEINQPKKARDITKPQGRPEVIAGPRLPLAAMMMVMMMMTSDYISLCCSYGCRMTTTPSVLMVPPLPVITSSSPSFIFVLSWRQLGQRTHFKRNGPE